MKKLDDLTCREILRRAHILSGGGLGLLVLDLLLLAGYAPGSSDGPFAGGRGGADGCGIGPGLFQAAVPPLRGISDAGRPSAHPIAQALPRLRKGAVRCL